MLLFVCYSRVAVWTVDMSGSVISKKRAARIERRKSKIAAVFNISLVSLILVF